MLYGNFLVILFTLLFLISSTSIYASDFNIKLRKTEISDLKQQLMPTFEQNIQVLKKLLLCLEQGKSVDVCVEQLSMASAQIDQNNDKDRQEQISLDLKQKLHESKMSQKQIIKDLEQLLLDAEKVKNCLNQGQTANDLKDCIIQYRN